MHPFSGGVGASDMYMFCMSFCIPIKSPPFYGGRGGVCMGCVFLGRPPVLGTGRYIYAHIYAFILQFV